MSPALEAVLGFLSKHRTFTLSAHAFQGRFDNGLTATINSVKIEKMNDGPNDARYLADVEGELMMFKEDTVETLCPCSAGTAEALNAFRKATPLRWFLVL